MARINGTVISPRRGAPSHTVQMWVNQSNKRAVHVANSAQQGLHRVGYGVDVLPSVQYRGETKGDIALFYGLTDPLLRIFHDYRKAGKTTILIDLGYWGRKPQGQLLNGYHKVVVNGLQPELRTLMSGGPESRSVWPSDRFNKLGIELQCRTLGEGDYYLLAGMSAKAAWVYGLAAEEWEKNTVLKMRQCWKTSFNAVRSIMYRPKPSSASEKIAWNVGLGDLFSGNSDNYDNVLRRAYATVSHHSNVALDGLVLGIPCFVETGITKVVSGQLDFVSRLYYPTDAQRHAVCCAAAYHQWTPEEMRIGSVWAYLKALGELP